MVSWGLSFLYYHAYRPTFVGLWDGATIGAHVLGGLFQPNDTAVDTF